MQRFLNKLPFTPDDFQLDAMGAIEEGHSVVVCSPTGSGKTLIAEYAAHKGIEEGRKVFYTTPLKALSNQKFNDFKKDYGEERVGLLTGDISINREGEILVMTTEVFRNMLYGVQEDSHLLKDVSCVVLDECHFMNDSQRGTVWEESIIYCPDTCQIIALSATVANALELTDWINEVHHNTVLVSSDFRPVPLRLFYFTREELMPLYKFGSHQLNSRLKSDHQGKHLPKHLRAFDPNRLILELHQREMLPAIFFTFSRRGCDKHLFETHNLNLLTPLEKQRLTLEIENYIKTHPFLEGNRYLSQIANGFASHHAGLLPALKGLVEHLFQQGLIKVVFATETLAAGINMPARTTVITAISKRTNDGHRILTPSEFLQMSGRAGRRGMDEIGYVVVVSTPYESAHDVAILGSSPPDPLNSQFTPTYGMVLNLLQKHTLEEAEFLISKSFGAFTADRRIQPLRNQIDEYTHRVDQTRSFQCPVEISDGDFQNYLKSKDILEGTQKLIKIFRAQMKQHGRSDEIQEALSREEGRKTALLENIHSMPCYTCKEYRLHIQQGEKLQRFQKKLKQLNHQYDEEKDLYWRQFMSHYLLLKEVGFLDENNFPTEPGKLTAQIRAENEFYLAQVILNGLLENLTPSQLAGVVCALVNDSTRDNQYSRLRFSKEGRTVTYQIQGVIKSVQRLQEKYRIETPMILNPIASGLVEAWIDGAAWSHLVRSTSIDEGDLVRIIRRTGDVLRQLSRINYVSSTLSDTAHLAVKALYRDPIREETAPLEEEEEQFSPKEPEKSS
jgi:superfamily II RNA helicase